jgi:hypothetical protein
MSAHIRLFGEKHHLSTETLQVIRDSVDSVEPALAEGITAYLDQVVEDDIAVSPLAALERVGWDILAIVDKLPTMPDVAWTRDTRHIGTTVVDYAANRWPYTPEADEGAYCTLANHCADLEHWGNMLDTHGYPVGAAVNELAKRLRRIINSMELCG